MPNSCYRKKYPIIETAGIDILLAMYQLSTTSEKIIYELVPGNYYGKFCIS